MKKFFNLWNSGLIKTTVGLSFLLAPYVALPDEICKIKPHNDITLNVENEEKIVEDSFQKLERLILNAKNVEVFTNPNRVHQGRPSNRCRKITDELLTGQVKSITTLPYESSTRFTSFAKNSSGEAIFLSEASEKYGGCSENIFNSIRQTLFYKNLPKIQELGTLEDPIDIENPISWRLIKLKNTLLLLEVSHHINDEKIKFIAALYLHPDDDGFLTGYVNGNKIEKPDCAEDFFDLNPTQDKKSFIVAFPIGDALVAAFFMPEMQSNTQLPFWASLKPNRQILALHFLDYRESYLKTLRKADNGLDPLIDSDCLLSIPTLNSADGEHQ